MIEYALLFGLGFLAAAFLAMLVAPAIQHRIVVYAENRLKATMPLSPQEVRAQRDMARAAFAAEQSKTVQDLAQEREMRVNLQVSQERTSREAARLHSENSELKMQINEMSVEAGDLRSALRQGETRVAQLQETIASLEMDLSQRSLETEDLRKQVGRLSADRDNLKIDLAARNAQLENDRYRLQSLRDERDGLRREVKLLSTRAKAAEQRLEQEEHKALKLGDKLAREQAGLADKDDLIQRRTEEIQRLREKIKAISAETREARKLLKSVPAERRRKNGSGPQAIEAPVADLEAAIDENEDVMHELEALHGRTTAPLSVDDLPQLKDEMRHQSAALSELFLKSRSPGQDDALREELASVAARMVAITALDEGDQSPIHAILDAAAEAEPGQPASLADRSKALLPEKRQTSA